MIKLNHDQIKFVYLITPLKGVSLLCTEIGGLDQSVIIKVREIKDRSQVCIRMILQVHGAQSNIKNVIMVCIKGTLLCNEFEHMFVAVYSCVCKVVSTCSNILIAHLNSETFKCLPFLKCFHLPLTCNSNNSFHHCANTQYNSCVVFKSWKS